MDMGHYHTVRVAATDLNGQMRGKRVPVDYAQKLDSTPIRMPFSALNADIFGYDIEGSPLVFETGDADGVLRPTDRGLVPLPWLESSQALLPMEMFHENGASFAGDARHALSDILQKYTAQGLDVIAATELEFTLVDDTSTELSVVKDPRTNRPVEIADVLSVTHMDAYDGFLTALYKGAEAMGINAQTTTKESGIGQFEITLAPSSALRAADDTWLMKHLIKGTARQYGLAATFMAKPFAQEPGNGLHMHFSVLDQDGKNIFDNGGPEGTERLRAAVAGCLAAMPASTLIFAPHANSYDRLVPDHHAPTTTCWGYDNRTVALRIPSGPGKARRIEHRVAGGDCNPYLVFAAVIGAAMAGMETGQTPPKPLSGNAYDQQADALEPSWAAAIDRFSQAPEIKALFHPDLILYFTQTKRQELREMAQRDPKEDWKIYLETV